MTGKGRTKRGRVAVTDDTLLGGRVKFRQPGAGYRAAIDPVLLAAAVPAGPGDKVLDAGSGAGAAMLCLARRVPECQVTGLELQEALVALATQNILANDFDDRVEVLAGDLLRKEAGLVAGSVDPEAFDHVMANPPHIAAETGTAPADPSRAMAHMEGAADLGAWVRFCLMLARPGASVTLIHRADRLDEILSVLHGEAGGIVVFPFWPKAGQPARRIVVQARKGTRAPTRLAAGLVLHREDGSYTDAAEAVLRDGAALVI